MQLYASGMRSKKYLRTIRDAGKLNDFVEYLLHMNSAVINIYAARFCNKCKLKPVDIEDDKYLEKTIQIAKTKINYDTGELDG